VTFDGYATRYRPGLDLVLNDVSVDITGGEKVDVLTFVLCSIQSFTSIHFFAFFGFISLTTTATAAYTS